MHSITARAIGCCAEPYARFTPARVASPPSSRRTTSGRKFASIRKTLVRATRSMMAKNATITAIHVSTIRKPITMRSLVSNCRTE
ncbi:hypothetical protein D3C87_1760040 [compost metagenome]